MRYLVVEVIRESSRHPESCLVKCLIERMHLDTARVPFHLRQRDPDVHEMLYNLCQDVVLP